MIQKHKVQVLEENYIECLVSGMNEKHYAAYKKYCEEVEDLSVEEWLEVVNYGEGVGNVSYQEWLDIESENDPNFFRWLFDNDEYADFGKVSDEDMNEFREFKEGAEIGDWDEYYL